MYRTPSYGVNLLLGRENLLQPKIVSTFQQALLGIQIMFLPEISLVPLS